LGGRSVDFGATIATVSQGEGIGSAITTLFIGSAGNYFEILGSGTPQSAALFGGAGADTFIVPCTFATVQQGQNDKIMD
jgi:hypothetical protein